MGVMFPKAPAIITAGSVNCRIEYRADLRLLSGAWSPMGAGAGWSLLAALSPAKTEPPKHPQPHHQCSAIIDVPPLAQADSGMECDGTLDDAYSASECDVHEVGVELEVDFRIQVRQQTLKRFAADQLESGSNVGERSPAQVLQLEHFAHEEVTVVHESPNLPRLIPTLFHDPPSI